VPVVLTTAVHGVKSIFGVSGVLSELGVSEVIEKPFNVDDPSAAA
jgi:hypothetical protein